MNLIKFGRTLLVSLGTIAITAEANYEGPAEADRFDHAAALTGSNHCSLLVVVMDESNSMTPEQDYIKAAVNNVVADVRSGGKVDNVFVCSNGYGTYQAHSGNKAAGHFHGCSDATTPYNATLSLDPSIMDWVSNGHKEDSYEAMYHAVRDIPYIIPNPRGDDTNMYTTCGTMTKNMMLITDEDRDIRNNLQIDPDPTIHNTIQHLKDNGFTINIICNVFIYQGPDVPRPANCNENTLANCEPIGVTRAAGVRAQYDSNGNQVGATLFYPDENTVDSYAVQNIQNINATVLVHEGFPEDDNSHTPQSWLDYPRIAFETGGGIWDINFNGDYSNTDTLIYHNKTTVWKAFSSSFEEIKILEVVEDEFFTLPPAMPTKAPTVNGDPHFHTWKREHFEYHGQCDMVLFQDEKFLNDLGLQVHIRTKLVRYWSYVKAVAIRIGDDILEVEGTAEETHIGNQYWFNYVFQGDLDQQIGGFPVTTEILSSFRRKFEICLDKAYPGLKIVIQTYKEFVRIDVLNPSEEAFKNTVGLMGDFKTGKTLARDGATVMDDFIEFGNEWQVLPSDQEIFHKSESPQFPEKCIDPEDPRGDRHRRRKLEEMSVTEKQAEAACAKLPNADDRKDCVYDILATQDIGMVGAY